MTSVHFLLGVPSRPLAGAGAAEDDLRQPLHCPALQLGHDLGQVS